MTTTRGRPTRKESEAISVAGRVGLVGRGVTYVVIGVLALMVAFGHRERPSRQGAIAAVVEQPFGRGLVALLAVAFAAFAAWRLAEAVLADEWSKRLAQAARSLLYLGFLYSAVPYAREGRRHGDGGHREIDVTARILAWPGGRWLVMAVGVAVLAGGLWNGYRALSQRYRKRLKWREMSPAVERVVPVLGTGGFVGRMSALCLVGAFVIKAAWQYRPDDAGGLDVALLRVHQHTFGSVLVALVGAGLLLFGLYCFVEARYRKIPAK